VNFESSHIQIRALLQKQRVFGTPGAALTWGIVDARKAAVAAGLDGERVTGESLNQYATNRNGVYVFHSAEWPGATAGDTDHLILRGNQLLLIDAKRWKAKRKYSVTASGQVLRGTVRFPEGKVKMLGALNSWRKILPKGTRLAGAVCIAQKETFVPYDANWYKAPFKLITLETLHTFLDTTLKGKMGEPELVLQSHIAAAILPLLQKAKPGPKRINFS